MAATDRQLYSFVVLLKVRFASGSYQCGGSLIAPDVVMTAAHCVAQDPQRANASDLGAHAVTALLGWQDTRDYTPGAPVPATEPTAEVLAAVRWTWHELFNESATSGVVNAHDIALVWLSSPSAYSTPTALDFPPGTAAASAAGTAGLALGWGITRALRVDDPISGSTATKLQRVRVPLAAGAYCDAQAKANANEYDDTRQVCTSTDGGVDTCYGDSGGPLLSIAASADNWAPGIQFGIVSYGYGCAVPGYYAVYTRIACYMPWLQARVASLAPPAPTTDAVAAAADAAAAQLATPPLQPGTAQLVVPMRVGGVGAAAGAALPAAIAAGLASLLAPWSVAAANVTVSVADATLPLRLGFAAAPLTVWNANVSRAVAAAAALDLGIAASRLRLGCATAAVPAATPVQAPPSAGRRRLHTAAPEVFVPIYVSGFGADASAAAALAATAAAATWPRTLAALASEAKLNMTPPSISTAAALGGAIVSLLASVAMPGTAAYAAATATLNATSAAASLGPAIGATLRATISLQLGSVALTVAPPAPAPAAVAAPGVSGTLIGPIIGAAGGGAFAVAAVVAFLMLRRTRLKRRHAEAAEAIAAGVPLAALLSRPSMAGFPAEALRAAQQRAAALDVAEPKVAAAEASVDAVAELDAADEAYAAAVRRSKAVPRMSDGGARPPRAPRRSMPGAPIGPDEDVPRYMRPRTSAPRVSAAATAARASASHVPRFSSHALSTRGSETGSEASVDPRAPRRSQLWSLGMDAASNYTDSEDGDAATPGDAPRGRPLPRWSMQAPEGEGGQPRPSMPRYSRPRMSSGPATHIEAAEEEEEDDEEAVAEGDETAPPFPTSDDV